LPLGEDYRKRIHIKEQRGGTASTRKNLTGCGKTPLHRHSRESGSPEGIEKNGFLLPQE